VDSSRKFTLCFSNYSESKALKKFRLIAYTVIAIISLASIAQCQGLIGFDRGSFGSVVLSQKQSLGTDLQLELSIGSYENEPIINYSSGSVFAQIGKSVGRLDVLTDKGLFPCTAFIVSTKYILTNYHCSLGLLNDERIGATRIDATQFVAGYLQTGIEAESKKYTVIPTPKEYSKRLDYAVLEVIGDPSQEYGQLKLANITPNDGDPFWIIGHPMGEGQRISREKCKANNPALSGDKLLHTCDTLPGNSGSPVIDAGLQQVVALHHAGSQKDSVNYAILMSEILKNSKVLKAYKAPKVLPVETKETISCDALYNAAANAKACYAYDVYIDKCSAHTLAPMARGYVKEFCKQTLIKKDNNLSEPVKMKEQTCPEDIKKCKPKFLCRMATEKTNSKTVWETSVTLQKYVNEAKRRGISCGTGKKTCFDDVKRCSLEQLCLAATENDTSKGKVWAKNIDNKKHVIEAKKRGLSCRVNDSKTCPEDIKKCKPKFLCRMATEKTNSKTLWETSINLQKYVNEAKRRKLSCGVNLNENIKNGMVMSIQRQLNNLGCNAGSVDGILGSRTLSALMRWKSRGGIYTVNNVNEDLLRRLNSTSVKCLKKQSSESTSTDNYVYLTCKQDFISVKSDAYIEKFYKIFIGAYSLVDNTVWVRNSKNKWVKLGYYGATGNELKSSFNDGSARKIIYNIKTHVLKSYLLNYTGGNVLAYATYDCKSSRN